MRTTIPWGDGTGDNIYLDYSATDGDQTILVSSDANSGSERTKSIQFSASGVSPVTLTVKQEESLLPPGYTKLTYLSNENTADALTMAYIDTGIKADGIGYISSDLWYGGTPNISIGDGSVYNSSTPRFYVLLGIVPQNNTPKYGVQFGGDSTEKRFATSYGNRVMHTIAIDVLNKKAYCDQEEISITVGTARANPIFLFWRSRNNSTYTDKTYAWGSGRGRVKIYDKSMNLVRDFIPAVNTNGVAGMYDRVTGTLFTSPNGSKFDQDTSV